MGSRDDGRGVLVIGLGRFGGALAKTLVDRGNDVLAVDENIERVQRFSPLLTHVIAGDSTDTELLDQIGAADFEFAVVAIGNDVEASILTTAALSDLEIPNIWAKAVSDQHRRILERVGAHRVVHPEQEMGQRMAHLVTGRMLDYLLVDDDFVLVETSAPADVLGRSLADSHVRERFEITVMAIKPVAGSFTPATADTHVHHGDTMLIGGSVTAVEAFADLD